jgi:hypothetical protein
MKKIILLLICILPYYGFGSDVCSSDFLLEDGLILVKATVDQRSGLFILDTGAPCLILNARRFDVEQSGDQVMSVNEKLVTKEKTVTAFEWGCIEKKYFKAIAIDLSHLEQALDTPILGLIGYEVLTRHEILIDYDEKKIEQYPAKKSSLHATQTASLNIPFEMSGHLPIVSAEIENYVLHLAFDSASESNLLDQAYQKKLSKEIDPKLIIFRGADQRDILVTAVNISSTYISEERFRDMEYLFKDVQKIRDIGHNKFDGLLGHPFIEACGRLSINYKKKQIFVWDQEMTVAQKK